MCSQPGTDPSAGEHWEMSCPSHSGSDLEQEGLQDFHCQLKSIPSHTHFSLNVYIAVSRLHQRSSSWPNTSLIFCWLSHPLSLLLCCLLLFPFISFNSHFYSFFAVLTSSLCAECTFLGERLGLKVLKASSWILASCTTMGSFGNANALKEAASLSLKQFALY